MNNFSWLFALLLLPLITLQMMHSIALWPILNHVFFSAAITTLLNVAQYQKTKLKNFFKLFLVIIYFLCLFMLLFEVILFDFTGNGFNDEVYFHFEFQSLKIGFNEYPVQLLAFVFLLLFYAFLINKLLNSLSHVKGYWLLITAITLLLTGIINSPLARFSSGAIDYLWQENVELNEELIKQYVDLGVLQNNTITTKNNLSATTTKDSKNLILLYLESFNEGLLHLDQYPGLTPQLNQLSQRYENLNHLSSSYVTIEGLISSQCGTMLPMTAGNNTFLNEGKLLSKMPCLGDVLNQAGYTQYFLGGAKMDFAGKGHFLKTHGYDNVWGLGHWRANGFRETKGIWGLTDTQLFSNALDTINEAAKNPPYHITLLTLGTHLPGYTYEGCSPYSGSDEPFINAIHCTDQLVGQFVKQLEQSRILDNALLLIIADHGIFPAVKMKELFGSGVKDRRLIGITNHQPLPNHLLSSYDLAPTILDMLKIKHNALFLYGKSLFKKSGNQQKHVTRTADWQDGKMILNSAGNCTDYQKPEWPLIKCHKQQLLNLTNQLLKHYSLKDQPKQLSCELEINFAHTDDEKTKGKWSLRLNDVDHLKNFYHKGRLLNSSKIRNGAFVFILNNESAIEKHIYIEDKNIHSHLQQIIQANDNTVLIAKPNTQSTQVTPINQGPELQIELHKKSTLIWSKKSSSPIKGLNICQSK